MEVAIVGGTGVYELGMCTGQEVHTVPTPYGEAAVGERWYGGRRVWFVTRHGVDHSVPPHRVNYRANMWALRKVGVERIIATAAVGSMRPEIGPGSFVFVDQFMDFTRDRVSTFFDGEGQALFHVDLTEPYCPELRSIMGRVASQMGISARPQGVYVCTEGPRLETPAEIRAYAALGGDVVGMTGVPEAVLAREAGLCYAVVAFVTNMAAGMGTGPITREQTRRVIDRISGTLAEFLRAVIEALPAERGCGCALRAGPLNTGL